MKPVVASTNDSSAFKLHFVQINDRIQDNFTLFLHTFSKGKKFTLVEYQCNCMEIDLSDKTNNVQVIKYFSLQLFVLSINKIFEFSKKSEIHTFCD